MERGGKEIQEKQNTLNVDFRVFSRFFYPENIVVIGVSSEAANLGKNIVMNCLRRGYRGEILSVGLRGGVVFGQQIYRSVEEIDREIDLAVILTPAKTVPGILEQCGRKGIRWVVIESGGFSELGEEGGTLEEACRETAGKYDIRFIGPNGIGITNLENGLALPFWPIREDLGLGPVSVLAQSGGVGLSYLGFLAEENIGINKFVSMGNKLNVDENDLLGYLMEDPGTKVILVYLEGFTDGRRFIRIASRSKKPILVHKSNRFQATSNIAHSHTAALFANDTLVDQALAQAGCLRVNTMDDAIDYLKAFTLPALKGNRLAVVSRSGGHAVIAADACAHYGFELPAFPKDLLKKIESRLRAHVIRLQNPMDLGDLFELEFYRQIVEEVLKRDDIDGILLGHGYRRGFEHKPSRTLIGNVAQLVQKYEKPVALVIFADAMEIDHLKKNYPIPIFTAPENAMRAIHLSYVWSRHRRPSPAPESIDGVDRERIEAILKNRSDTDHLLLSESIDLLQSCGIQTVPCALADSEESAVRAWRTRNGPVAMKINRPHHSHKTDSGALKLDLKEETAVRRAFLELETLAGGSGTEVLIQDMAPAGLEVMLGGKQDDVFGPTVLFGLGGILVEALEDVAWRLAPVSNDEAGRMVRSIRGHRILRGLRGDAPRDVSALIDRLVRLSWLLHHFPQIREIDVNPLLVYEEKMGARAVDARVILAPQSTGKTS